MSPRIRLRLVLALLLVVYALPLRAVLAQALAETQNMFANPSFEMGRASWDVQKGQGTVVRFTVDNADAVAGQHSALVAVDAIGGWGVQFGQTMDAGRKGKTYTFAVLAKAPKGSVSVSLEIERSGDPWDRAVKSERFTLDKDQWTELHVTFEVPAAFPEGWFAYISCSQPNAQFRADMFQLYEGDFVPYEETARQEALSAGVHLFDTGVSSAAPLPADALSKMARWTELPEDEVAHEFQGDAILLNSRLAIALHPKGRGTELYSVTPAGLKMRALLTPVADGRALELSSVKIVENNPSVVTVDAAFRTANAEGGVLRYELRMGQVFVKTESRGGVTGLRVEAHCRFAVLPDFFADDIVIDAVELPVSEAELPSENFLLHLLPDREAIVMAVWESREQDVRIELSGQDEARAIRTSHIRYGNDGRIWIALMEARRTWHVQDIASKDAGRIIRLDWKAPYAAQWRVDWRKNDNLADSWAMAIQRPDGRYMKPDWFRGPGRLPADRSRWTTVLGSFHYPCWVDQDGQGYLQPLSRVVRFQGPAVIYPINRVSATPLDAYTVVDIVRDTLGVGPCEYILDVEKQRSEYKGTATCGVRDFLNPIYEKGQQKQRGEEIEKALVNVLIFIRHIRGRIENYVEFGHDTLDYLAEQKESHPELAEPLAQLEGLARAIDARVALRKDQIKTLEFAESLADEFRATLLDYEGGDALQRCKKFTEAWVKIGGNQDELAGECRMAVKILRQQAGLAMALDPRMAEVASEIRRRTQIVLRNPAGHEGARH